MKKKKKKEMNEKEEKESWNLERFLDNDSKKPFFKGNIGFKPGKKVKVSAQGGINTLRGLV